MHMHIHNMPNLKHTHTRASMRAHRSNTCLIAFPRTLTLRLQGTEMAVAAAARLECELSEQPDGTFGFKLSVENGASGRIR